MKKIISKSVVLVLVCFFTISVYQASAETNTDIRANATAEATVRIDGKEMKVPVMIRSAQQQKLDAQKEQRLGEEKLRSETPVTRVGLVTEFKSRFERTIKLLESIHNRLSGIEQRISNRIEKTATSETISAESKKYLEAAREDLRKARVEIDAAVNVYTKEVEANTTITNTRPANISAYFESNFSKSNSHIRAARELLKSAHKNLMSAVRSLKMGMSASVKVQVGI